MINLYTGTPGSGKSLHVTEVIYHKLRAGINVISNFPVDDDIIYKSPKVDKSKQFNYNNISTNKALKDE